MKIISITAAEASFFAYSSNLQSLPVFDQPMHWPKMTDAFNDVDNLPYVIHDNLDLFSRFRDESRTVAIELLKALSDIFKFTDDKRFERFHTDQGHSFSCVNLIRYQRSNDYNYFGQNQHTDNGTLIFLLTEQLGLQVQSKDGKGWSWVAPKKDYAVINVADTLRFMSGKALRSSIHRAVPLWIGDQQYRNTIGFFLRANDDTVLQDIDGEMMTATDWHDRKYVNYVLPHEVQRTNTILLGGMEAAPLGPARSAINI